MRIVEAVAWPAAAVILLLVSRGEIAKLLSRGGYRVKTGAFEMDVDRVEELRASVAAESERPAESQPRDLALNPPLASMDARQVSFPCNRGGWLIEVGRRRIGRTLGTTGGLGGPPVAI